MRFRLLTLLLVLTAVCLALGLTTLAERIPVGAVGMVGLPIGISMGLLAAAWRRADISNRILVAVLFVFGWCFLLAYVELGLEAMRPAEPEDRDVDTSLLSLGIALFSVPACLLGMLLLRAWLWSWHDQFDKL